MPTFKVEPEEAIEETAFICMCPTADMEAGPEANDTALTVNSGAIAKVAELDKLALASDSEAEVALIVAVEESAELPNLVTSPSEETVADPFRGEDTPTSIWPAEETVPDEDKADCRLAVIEPREETLPIAFIVEDPLCIFITCDSAAIEAVEDVAETPPIITTPEEGVEPVLVIKLAATNSRIPTSVIEAEADTEEVADIVLTATLTTDPTEDKEAEIAASTKGSELTEAEPEMEDAPPIITTPEEGFEPVLVNRLATPNSRIPTSVMEAEADIEEATDIV